MGLEQYELLTGKTRGRIALPAHTTFAFSEVDANYVR